MQGVRGNLLVRDDDDFNSVTLLRNPAANRSGATNPRSRNLLVSKPRGIDIKQPVQSLPDAKTRGLLSSPPPVAWDTTDPCEDIPLVENIEKTKVR
eukprot:631876-Prorocentrum_minimum.AAC.2